MATCKWCGKKGFFLSVDRNGLCLPCCRALKLEAESRLRVIRESQDLVNKSKKLDTVLSRIDTIIEHCDALLKYEKAGINIIEPPPSTIIKIANDSRHGAIIKSVKEEVDKHMTKAKVATTPRSQITQASKALEKIEEGKKLLKSPQELDSLKMKVKAFVHTTQLNAYIEAAQKAEFKGQTKKAIDQYQEALYFIKNDDIDNDLQAEEIARFEKKISDLNA